MLPKTKSIEVLCLLTFDIILTMFDMLLIKSISGYISLYSLDLKMM